QRRFVTRGPGVPDVEPVHEDGASVPRSQTSPRAWRYLRFRGGTAPPSAFASTVSDPLLQFDEAVGAQALRLGTARLSCQGRDRRATGREFRDSPEPQHVFERLA